MHRKIGMKYTTCPRTGLPGVFLMIDHKINQMLFTPELVQDLKASRNMDVIEKIIEVMEVPILSDIEREDLNILVRRQDWV